MNQRYPRRLFTKMLIAFLLVFILISQIIWLGFSLLNPDGSPFVQHKRELQQLQLNAAVTMLAHAGPQATAELVGQWQDVLQPSLILIKAPMQPQPATEADSDATYRQQVVAADGQTYQLILRYPSLPQQAGQPGRTWQDFLHIPTPVLIFAPCLGLFFSLLLAWNMTRPIRQLRDGFDQISRGDLSVRLYPQMRRRFDELALVAQDFDAMVERLSVLVKAREALLHDISHELRTPLARVQLAIGLARQSSANIPNSLERIEQEAERLDKMIGELLALSRAEHQGVDDEQYFDFTALLEVILADVRYEAQQPEVFIDFENELTRILTVCGNAELIRRGIENVLRNALRYSQSGQHILVRLSSEHNHLLLSIADNGPGVEEDKLSSMFDPFVRLQSTQSGKGYGLGLAIVRKVILAHHGQVTAKNRSERGLEIEIRLPIWQGE